MKAIALAAAILASGCASNQRHEVVREIKVPVAVPCIASVPALPQVAPDAAMQSMDDFDLVLEIERQRRVWRAYAVAAHGLLTACSEGSNGKR